MDETSKPLLGMLLTVAAVFMFAISDILTKHLAMQYPVSVVIGARYLTSLVLLLLILGPKMRARLWRVNNLKRVLLRAAILSLGSLTMGLALRLMPVGETVAIVYLSPFLVMALAVPLLGEKVTALNWFLALLAFSGVLIILRPGAGLDTAGIIFALLNAGCATAFHLMTRVLSKTESAVAMLFHVTLMGAVGFGVAALPNLAGLDISIIDVGFMLLLGVTASSGHFIFSIAYKQAPASLIAPMNYLHLVWAALLGWVIFDHLPDHWTLIGMLLIIAAGMALALKAHLKR